MFVIETENNVAAMTELYLVLRKTVWKTRTKVETGAAVGAAMILLCAAATWTESWHQWYLWLATALALGTIIFVRRNADERSIARRLARRTLGVLKRDFTRVRFTFEPGQFTMKTPSEEGVLTYSLIECAFETEDYFILIRNRQQGYVLKKSGFLRGEPAEFSVFLSQQLATGAPAKLKT